MPKKLRYIILEDIEMDALLLSRMLKRSGYDPEYLRVETEEEFRSAFAKGEWDLVISDYRLPSFSGMQAIRVFQECGPDVPFILVSGVVGEEVAVECLLAGAHDFIVKGKWDRLVPAIRRELKDARTRAENRIREESLKALYELNQMKDASDKDIGDFVLDKGVELTSSRFGFIGFMKEDGTTLDVHAWSRDAMKACDVKELSIHFPLDKAGLWAEAARQGKAIVVNDYGSFPHWKKGLPEGHVALSNLLVVPLFDRESASAIISVGNKPRDYRDSDVRQLTLLMEGMWRFQKERKAEREIKELNQRIEFILGVTNTGLDIIDAGYHIRYIDPTWGKVYGDPSGKKCFEYFMGRDKPCPDCGIQKALRTRTPVVKEHILPKEGNRPIQVTTIPFQDEEGNWLVAEANVDITERKKAEEAIQKRMEVEKCLSTISRIFATRSHPDFNLVLQHLGKTLSVNRAYIFLIRKNGETIDNTHEWLNGKENPWKPGLQDFKISDFPWWRERLEIREPVVLSDIDLLAEEATRERKIMKSHSMRSFLASPIYLSGGECFGFIGFVDTEKKREWTEEDMQLSMVGSEIISNYLARKKAEDGLRSSIQEKELLLREIHHRVKNNLQIVSGLLFLQAGFSKDKSLHDVFQKCQSRIETMGFIHEKLCHSESLTQIDARDFIHSLAAYLVGKYIKNPQKIDFDFQIQDISLAIDTAIPCGLIVNELISNIIHHAFPGKKQGKATIRLKKYPGAHIEGEASEEDEYELTVADEGVELSEDMNIKETRSFGLYLVFNLVEKQLHGSIELNRAKGTEFIIRFKEKKYVSRMRAARE